MRKALLCTLATALVLIVTTTAAPASPPSGRFSFRDLARSEIAGPGRVDLAPGADVSSSRYTFAAGAGSGWRSLPGSSLFVLTKGTLTLGSARGCVRAEYRAGQAAVMPAGEYSVTNAGTEPLEFVGVFLGLPVAGPPPLAQGAPDPAPPGCTFGTIAAAGAGPGDLADVGRATLVSHGEGYAGHHHGHDALDSIETQPGKDVLVSWYHFEPGFSTGWHTHDEPFIGIITKGALTYYDEQDGHCHLSGRYHAGQAFATIPGPGHRHLGGNYDQEPLEGYAVYINTPRKYPVPIFGNQLDAIDFSPTPPPGCPHLRDGQV